VSITHDCNVSNQVYFYRDIYINLINLVSYSQGISMFFSTRISYCINMFTKWISLTSGYHLPLQGICRRVLLLIPEVCWSVVFFLVNPLTLIDLFYLFILFHQLVAHEGSDLWWKIQKHYIFIGASYSNYKLIMLQIPPTHTIAISMATNCLFILSLVSLFWGARFASVFRFIAVDEYTPVRETSTVYIHRNTFLKINF